MIAVNNVTKQYSLGAPPALEDVTVNFENGKIYGLLGRNGAGKTTLINLMTGRIAPGSGSIEIDGARAFDNDDAQEKIFCMTEKGSYHPEMKVTECVKWAKRFYPNFDCAYAETLLERFGVDKKKRIRALSTGYGSIVKLILTLASAAEVMIFDEPTLGLDASMREIFYRELLLRYETLENTVILSTHLIGEIESLLERVVIIDDGKILVDTDAESLSGRASVITGPREKVEAFTAGKKVLHTETMGGFAAVTVDEQLSDADKRAALSLGLEVSGAKLQEIFIKLTAKGEQK